MEDDPTAPHPTDAAEEEDPVVEECLRDALAPYLDVLPPEEIADHRALLTLFIKTHPAAAPLYERLRKRRVTASSSDVPRERPNAGAAPTSPARLNGTTNGRRR
jgi:hypothetical protein